MSALTGGTSDGRFVGRESVPEVVEFGPDERPPSTRINENIDLPGNRGLRKIYFGLLERLSRTPDLLAFPTRIDSSRPAYAAALWLSTRTAASGRRAWPFAGHAERARLKAAWLLTSVLACPTKGFRAIACA